MSVGVGGNDMCVFSCECLCECMRLCFVRDVNAKYSMAYGFIRFDELISFTKTLIFLVVVAGNNKVCKKKKE